MPKKDSRLKKVNIKKERQKLIKEKMKQMDKKEYQKEKKNKSILDKRLEKETNLYWYRALTGALSGLIGRVIGFYGLPFLIWMLCFWFLMPFVTNFVILKYKYDKETWNWKKILKPGLGIFFLLFMITSTVVHTFFAFL